MQCHRALKHCFEVVPAFFLAEVPHDLVELIREPIKENLASVFFPDDLYFVRPVSLLVLDVDYFLVQVWLGLQNDEARSHGLLPATVRAFESSFSHVTGLGQKHCGRISSSIRCSSFRLFFWLCSVGSLALCKVEELSNAHELTSVPIVANTNFLKGAFC